MFNFKHTCLKHSCLIVENELFYLVKSLGHDLCSGKWLQFSGAPQCSFICLHQQKIWGSQIDAPWASAEMNDQKAYHTEMKFQHVFCFSVLKWKNDSKEVSHQAL